MLLLYLIYCNYVHGEQKLIHLCEEKLVCVLAYLHVMNVTYFPSLITQYDIEFSMMWRICSWPRREGSWEALDKVWQLHSAACSGAITNLICTGNIKFWLADHSLSLWWLATLVVFLLASLALLWCLCNHCPLSNVKHVVCIVYMCGAQHVIYVQGPNDCIPKDYWSNIGTCIH